MFVPELKFVTDWSYDHSKQSQEEQDSHGEGFRSHFEDVEVIMGNLGAIWDHMEPICGPEIKIFAG